MALSTNTVKRLMHALGDKSAAQELVDALNKAEAFATQCGGQLPAGAIVATNVSQTIDFGSLQVGDLVVMAPAVAGNADFIGPIATAGDLGQAAVVGNLYVVYRDFAAPAADATQL